MLAAALIIGYSAINMFKKAFKLRPAGQPAAGTDAAASPSTQSSGAPKARVPKYASPPRPPESRALGKPSLTLRRPGGFSSAAPSLTSLGEPAVSAPTVDDSSLSRKQLLQGARQSGLVASLASGYVGVGGGFIMVPLMLSIIGIPMRKASGTSLIAVMILAIPGVIEQGIIGNINYLAGIAIVIGTIPGAVVGARLVTKVPERTLRLLFGCFLIVAAVMLVLNEVGIFG